MCFLHSFRLTVFNNNTFNIDRYKTIDVGKGAQCELRDLVESLDNFGDR